MNNKIKIEYNNKVQKLSKKPLEKVIYSNLHVSIHSTQRVVQDVYLRRMGQSINQRPTSQPNTHSTEQSINPSIHRCNEQRDKDVSTHISVAVNGACQGNPLLLSTGKIDSLLPNFCIISSREQLQIRSQSASVNHLLIEIRLEWPAEEDVVFQRQILDPS